MSIVTRTPTLTATAYANQSLIAIAFDLFQGSVARVRPTADSA